MAEGVPLCVDNGTGYVKAGFVSSHASLWPQAHRVYCPIQAGSSAFFFYLSAVPTEYRQQTSQM